MSTIYVGMTFEVYPAEMEENTLAMPLNRNFNGAVIPHTLKEIGVSDSREGAFRAKWYEYLPIETGGPSESPLHARSPKIEGE
jgi:hypothetical protein